MAKVVLAFAPGKLLAEFRDPRSCQVSWIEYTPCGMLSKSTLLPIRPVGFMLPITGPGTAASPILKDVAKKQIKMHKLRCRFRATLCLAGGYWNANGCGHRKAKTCWFAGLSSP